MLSAAFALVGFSFAQPFQTLLAWVNQFDFFYSISFLRSVSLNFEKQKKEGLKLFVFAVFYCRFLSISIPTMATAMIIATTPAMTA